MISILKLVDFKKIKVTLNLTLPEVRFIRFWASDAIY